MRKYILTLLVAMPAILWASVQISISDGIDNQSVKTKMETKMSALLTEINAAQASGRALNFTNLNLSNSVQMSLSMLWENSPFMCTDDEIVERCLTTASGYQVRNIPLMMKPRADRNFGESEYQEAVISFDRQGNIESFYLSISMNLYMNVIKDGNDVTDLRYRQLILDWTERLRTSYNTKDIDFLEKVYSEDALIITGTVIRSTKDNISQPERIVYNSKSKRDYIAGLKKVFAKNKYIKVTFDDIKVTAHNNKPVYCVTLHQGYSASGGYHDDGYLVLIWDFRDENYPQITVRTWQPYEINGKPLPEEDIFKLDDFTIR